VENSGSGGRIVAAIDISRKYLEDTSMPTLLIGFRREKSDKLSDASERLLYRFNYIAYLVNSNRVDERYLSLQISCDIKNTFQRYEALLPKNGGSWIGEPVEEMQKFAQHAYACTSEGNVQDVVIDRAGDDIQTVDTKQSQKK